MRNLLYLAAIPVVVLAFFWLFQRRLLYQADASPPREPAVSGLRSIEISTDDGERLGAWLFSAPAASSTVLVLNGNAGHREGRLPIAERLVAMGANVVLFDYRGYGDSSGRPTEDGLIRDALAARAWIDAQPELAGGPVVYYGESLGAAVSIALAERRAPDALILRSPFTSAVDVARVHYPFLPVRWLLADRWPSIDRIRNLSCPLLVIAGTGDTVVPFEQSVRLHDAYDGDKRFVRIDDVDHNDVALLDHDVMERTRRFLEDCGTLVSR